MSIVAEHFAFVVGVDTHARSNTYAIITTRTGAGVSCAPGATPAAACCAALRKTRSTAIIGHGAPTAR